MTVFAPVLALTLRARLSRVAARSASRWLHRINDDAGRPREGNARCPAHPTFVADDGEGAFLRPTVTLIELGDCLRSARVHEGESSVVPADALALSSLEDAILAQLIDGSGEAEVGVNLVELALAARAVEGEELGVGQAVDEIDLKGVAAPT